MQILCCLSRRMAGLGAVLFLPAAISLSQAGNAPASNASPTPGSAAAPSSQCAPLADTNIPVSGTVEAKITGINSAHLKPGKEIWFKVAHGVIYAGCRLEADAVVYARIVSSTASKSPGGSELSLAFDRADCSGHDKQPFQFRLIAVVGPPDLTKRLHDAVPAEVAGRGRGIDNTMAATNALDLELNPGGPPHTVHPGIVVGVPRLKLEPTAGPECSDKLTSPDGKIELAPGSEFILAVTQTRITGATAGSSSLGGR